MNEIFFLGTGGGRFCTLTQWRYTGGFRINTSNINIHVDPGPGALVRSIQFKQNPQDIRAVLVSHVHPDHSVDAPIMIEAMTGGMLQEQGYIIGPKSVIGGTDSFGPIILPYHLEKSKDYIVGPGDSIDLEGVKVDVLPAKHRDPETVGFKFNINGKIVSYTSDTEYFPELAEAHKGVDILIANITRPKGFPIPWHLNSEGATKLINEVKPKIAILQHFGLKFKDPRLSPEKEAENIERGTGVRVIPAKDGMRISLDETDQKQLSEFV